jgi:hypothetical protein
MISWAIKQPTDPKTIWLLQRALWPVPVAKALWRYTKAVTSEFYERVAGANSSSGGNMYTGVSVPVPSNDGRGTQVPLAVKRQIPNATTSSEQSKDAPSAPSSSTANDEATLQAASHQRTSPNLQEGGKTDASAEAGPRLFPSGAADVFRGVVPRSAWKNLVRDLSLCVTINPRHNTPPRGSIYVSGQIFVETTRHNVTMQVAMWYNPKTEQYQMPPLEMQIREVIPKVSRFRD